MTLPNQIPLVTVLLETSHKASRMRFQGILDYVRQHEPWRLDYTVGGPLEQKISSSKRGRIHGIIARIPTLEVAQNLLSQKCPVVLFDPEIGLDCYPKLQTFPQVILANEKVGTLAAKYFLQKNYQNFAFAETLQPRNWATARRIAFTETLKKHGAECQLFTSHPRAEAESLSRLSSWLGKIPKPTAIFAASDIEGRQIIDECLRLRIAVPYQVAVLGVGNDRFICESCFPSLSSISIRWVQAGYAAAEMLDLKMKKQPLENPMVTYEPEGIEERISTEQGQIDDKLVIQVLEQIRLKHGIDVRVKELAQQFHVTRQWLQKRFHQVLGYNIQDEIQKRRLEKIRDLIVSTDLPFSHIAQRCGFEHDSYLRILFKKNFHVTMQEYREKNREL